VPVHSMACPGPRLCVSGLGMRFGPQASDPPPGALTGEHPLKRNLLRQPKNDSPDLVAKVLDKGKTLMGPRSEYLAGLQHERAHSQVVNAYPVLSHPQRIPGHSY